MRGEKQLTILVDGVTVVQNIWLANILEPCILDFNMLEQLASTMDTVSKHLIVSIMPKTREIA